MHLSKVTRNHQITIPAKIREIFHLEKGDFVGFEVKEDHIVLVPKKLVDSEKLAKPK